MTDGEPLKGVVIDEAAKFTDKHWTTLDGLMRATHPLTPHETQRRKRAAMAARPMSQRFVWLIQRRPMALHQTDGNEDRARLRNKLKAARRAAR